MLQRIIKLHFCGTNNIIIIMKKKVLIVLGIIIFAFIIEQFFSATALFEKLELITYDLRAKFSTDKGPFNSQFKHADKKIVLVAIDDYSKNKIANNPQLGIGSWPWQRDVWGGVVKFIEQGEPKAILFDIIFNGLNDNPLNDRKSAQIFKKYDNIVLATTLNDPERLVNNPSAVFNSDYIPTSTPLDVSIKNKKIDDSITYYSHSAIHNIYTKNNTMGVVNKVVDLDSVARKNQPIFKLIKNDETFYMPSLAFAGFLKYMGEGGKIIVKGNKIIYKGMIIPINSKGEVNISWHGTGHDYDYIPIADVLLSEENEKYIESDFFKDKIVIIGRTEAGSDIHLSSVNPSYAGPEINATALDNFINDSDPHNKKARKFVTRFPKWIEYLLIIFACASVALIGFKSKNAVFGLVNGFTTIFLYLLFCIWIFAYPGLRIWIPIVVPLYYLFMTAVIVFTIKLQDELSKKAVIMNMFGKFVSPKVLTTLMKNQDEMLLKSSRKQITVLFCDVKNFTSLSEKCNPEKLMDNLNELFNEIVNIIFENNGTVDKFIGDCVMAYWGDPIASEDDSYMAVKTALEIKKKVNELKIKNAQENKIILDVKMGINTGEALLGLAGSEKIMSYTAIGDAVNVASRLESACSKQGRDILISKTTYEEVKDKIIVLEAGKVELKGKDQQAQIYEPIGLNETPQVQEII